MMRVATLPKQRRKLMRLLDVLSPIVREIAGKLEYHKDLFDQDPELYIVALLLEAKNNLQVGQTIYGVLELACDEENMDEARKLLKRKRVTSK
jgi:hypothetical protein